MKQNRAVTAWLWLKNENTVLILICTKKPLLTPKLGVDWQKFDDKYYYYNDYCSHVFKLLFPKVFKKLTNKPERFTIKIGK